jgi:hypothetical protein
LNEIILLSDIGELAMEANTEFSTEASTATDDGSFKRPTINTIRWKSVKFDDERRPIDTDSPKSENHVATVDKVSGDDDAEGITGLRSLLRRSEQSKRHVAVVKNQLDRWEEPIDKSHEVSLCMGLFQYCDKHNGESTSSLIHPYIHADREYFNG